MNEGRWCITTDRDWWASVPRADRPYPCHRRGIRNGVRVPEAHYATCDDESCRGCVPRSAVDGTMLCPVCLEKIKDALGRLPWLIPHFRSIEKGPSEVGERVDTSMTKSILLPDSWDAADELMVALGASKFRSTDTIDEAIGKARAVVADWWANFDRRVNTAEGASQAVVTVKRMQHALHRWPGSEAERRQIPYVVCPECGQKNLYRRAPLEFLDDIVVECASDDCTYVHDWFEWSDIYAPIFEGIDREMRRREREQRRAEKEAS